MFLSDIISKFYLSALVTCPTLSRTKRTTTHPTSGLFASGHPIWNISSDCHSRYIHTPVVYHSLLYTHTLCLSLLLGLGNTTAHTDTRASPQHCPGPSPVLVAAPWLSPIHRRSWVPPIQIPSTVPHFRRSGCLRQGKRPSAGCAVARPPDSPVINPMGGLPAKPPSPVVRTEDGTAS